MNQTVPVVQIVDRLILDVPDHLWELRGPDLEDGDPVDEFDLHDPTAQLCATVTINGTDHHIDAHAVNDVETRLRNGVVVTDQVLADPAREDEVDAIRAATGGGRWDTTTIGGRDYVVIITPFG